MKKNSSNTIKVEMKVYENNLLTKSMDFSGSQKEAVTFINDNYSRAMLESFFNATILFKINNGDFETFESLVEKGVFEI